MKKLLLISMFMLGAVNLAYAAPVAHELSHAVQQPRQVISLSTKPTKVGVKKTTVVKKEAVICPMDAKMCEDGSFVGRVGPDCDFATCPKSLDDELDSDPNKDIEKDKEVSDEQEDNVLCTAEYKPVCAKVDTGVRCIKAPCPSSVKKVYTNACLAQKDKVEILHEGVCESEISSSPLLSTTPEDYLSKKIVSSVLVKPADKTIKAEKIANSIGQAETEEGRKSIFEKEISPIVKSEVVSKSTIQATVAAQEKKERVISKKSKEIFEKFDYFIAKGKSVTNKLDKTVKILESKGVEVTEMKIKIGQMQQNLKSATTHKVTAWLKFNMVLVMDNSEEIKESIEGAKVELRIAKENIKSVFADSKSVIKEIKEIIKK